MLGVLTAKRFCWKIVARGLDLREAPYPRKRHTVRKQVYVFSAWYSVVGARRFVGEEGSARGLSGSSSAAFIPDMMAHILFENTLLHFSVKYIFHFYLC